jgi:hypothetical protein
MANLADQTCISGFAASDYIDQRPEWPTGLNRVAILEAQNSERLLVVVKHSPRHCVRPLIAHDAH